MKKALLTIALVYFATVVLVGSAWGAAEVFYACSGGDGTLPESQVCATAWDLADVRSPANWTSTDADDGLIGPTEDILLLDTNDDPIKVGGRGFDFVPRIGPPFRPTIKWVDYTTLYDLFVYLHFTEDLSDSQGELADGTFARASASTYIDPDTGYLTMAHATRPQLFDTPAVPITQDITVEANKSYVGSYGSGGSIAFADNTSTSTQISVDDNGSVYITVTGAGDITATVTGSPSYGMLEEIPSDLALGPDLTVVGITSADPGVVTITGHGLLTGDYVQFKDLTEMTELNTTTKYVTKIGADTFSIGDTSAYVAETTGGACANKIPAAVMYAALGPVIATGTLSSGTSYLVISTETDNFGAGVEVGDVFTSGGTETCDANNTVKAIGQFISPSDYINAATIPAEPRFESDGLAFLGASVLNLLPYSEDFSEWTNSSAITPVFGSLGPDGGYTATILSDDGIGSYDNYFYAPTFVDDAQYCLSMFAKAGTAAKFSLVVYDVDATASRAVATYVWSGSTLSVDSVSPGTAGVREIGNGWWRAYVIVPASVIVGANNNRGAVYPSGFGIAAGSTKTLYAFGANLTETAFLAPYIPSHGAPTAIAAESLLTANTANLLNVIDIAEGDATSEGTLTTEITFGFSYTDLSGDVALLSLNDGTAFLYCDNAGNIEATDGTNTVNVDIDFAAGDTITVVLSWSATGDSIRMGILESGSWTWDGGSTAYDDDWAHGTNLNIGYSTAFPFHIKNTKFYSRALSPIVFDTTYVAGMYITTDGDYYVTADGDYYLPAN